ncbi:hypothetical protein COOONC_22038 [Cooperia oncophora]
MHEVECALPYGYEISNLTKEDARDIHQSSETKEPFETFSLNEVPFKLVPSYLTSIVDSSQESPFWTLWSRNSFPVPYVIQIFEKST